MLIANRKYLFQFIQAETGNRDDPFIMTPAELQENLIQFSPEHNEKYYVLVLADTTLDIKPQEFVSKFPLFTLQSWTNLTFNIEENNHGS